MTVALGSTLRDETNWATAACHAGSDIVRHRSDQNHPAGGACIEGTTVTGHDQASSAGPDGLLGQPVDELAAPSSSRAFLEQC